MKWLIGKLLRRGGADPQATLSSEMAGSDIEKYYSAIIRDALARMLVPAGSVDLKVRRDGTDAAGRWAYAGFVRLLSWDAVMTPVLLQNMPVIDARIRKVVRASELLEHTIFAGLWVQATCETPGAPQVLTGMPAELVRQRLR